MSSECFPRVLSKEEYLIDYRQRVNAAKQEVWSMWFDMDFSHPVAPLFHAMKCKAQEGVRVVLALSNYAVTTTHDWPDLLHYIPGLGSQEAIEVRRTAQQELQSLRQAGVIMPIVKAYRRWLNPIHLFRENHMKVCGVDEDIAYIPSLNPTRGLNTFAESIVALTDPLAVRTLRKLVHRMADNSWRGSSSIRCGPEYELIIDHKLKGNDSRIYDRAIQLIKSETEKIQLCAMLPYSGRMLKALVAKAESGVPIEIILSNHNDKLVQSIFHRSVYRHFEKEVRKQKNITVYEYPDLMHAKTLVTPRYALTGSHNLDGVLVLWVPPDEIDLLTTNEEIIRQLQEQFEYFKLVSTRWD